MRSSFLSFPLLAVATQAYGTITARQTPPGASCTRTMCVSAALNGSDVVYVLSDLGKVPLGWMAIGFGQSMINTPMVIMWSNSDGSVTLSQRTASSHVQPTLDGNPPRVATLDHSLTSTSGQNPTFAFSVPANGQTANTQNLIYAFGTTNPGSSAPDANLEEHIDNGGLRVAVSNGSPTTSLPTSSRPGSTTTGVPLPHPTSTEPHQSFPNNGIPLLPFQRLVAAHAIFCVIGFLFFLPAGAFAGRFFRTYTAKWFQAHWIIQFLISGTTIVIGVALGIAAVEKDGGSHFNDRHKRLGLALFFLYIAQGSLGAFIHFVKDKSRTRRPPQNYAHAVIGLLLVSLAMYQVWVGFKHEWRTTGLVPVPYGITILFFVWIVFISVAYSAGLAFLPKQFKQEAANRQAIRKFEVDAEPEYRD